MGVWFFSTFSRGQVILHHTWTRGSVARQFSSSESRRRAKGCSLAGKTDQASASQAEISNRCFEEIEAQRSLSKFMVELTKKGRGRNL